ncbi:MAG TPA: Ku protein [Clostridia bacterium]|nr:Ku protein [Clostridia bacterium]
MRALWTGHLTFGLVTIPIRVFLAAQRRAIHFTQLHRKCGSPIRYRKWCPVCEVEVEDDDIQMGYGFQKDRYVLLTEEELQGVRPQRTGSVEVVDFVDAGRVDPIYFEKAYYLEPGEGGFRAYSLLSWALKESEKTAISKVILRTRETLAAIRPYDDRGLVMHAVFYPDEIRSFSELEGVNVASRALDQASAKEKEMALTLVERLSVPFDLSKYRDETREKLNELIEAKLRGEEVTVPRAKEPAKVIDLMEALRASVELAEKRRTGESIPRGEDQEENIKRTYR